MTENLAEQVFAPEPEEHDQESICAIELDGAWVELVPGTLDLVLTDQGEVEFVADTPFGGTVSGVLSSVTGLRSLPLKEGD